MNDNTKDKLEDISNLIFMAQKLIANKSEKEKIYRKALSQLFSIYKKEERNHIILNKMYEVGILINEEFGCKIPFENNEYWQKCPIKLAQIKLPLGVSIGAICTEVCSICEKDFLDCTHVKGQYYDHVLCRKNKNRCNICLKDNCQHEEGVFYDKVQAIGLVIDMKFDHVALVDNPLEPDAGIMAIAYDKKIASTMLLRNGLKWGDDLQCNYCMGIKNGKSY